ncbi:D-aminoacyl-tRNA deacylase [Acanthopleuribacter pedis]|uniref:D-aminoacyl-tRNA deacylase n=1 Tax=Acanthopleuribacter pedis TaxID=442870 RepID=A0A8J7QJQ7_9BACT|nr:D-aminoacyl-tRNA deacylase [Acanthopleuribacter pedis]MBO1321335.1 D-tyrosyl-tRNA(Tyr) deacylase [Acanthopleuribacter pedis]
MRVLLQRVSHAEVSVEGSVTGSIKEGYLLLAGSAAGDDLAMVRRMAEKIVHLRLFPNEAGKFDRSLLQVGGGVLVVSQFTLYGDARKGRRPSFTGAAPPDLAEPLVEAFAAAFEALDVVSVGRGRFGAHMKVSLCNEGPVTLWLDSDTLFPR